MDLKKWEEEIEEWHNLIKQARNFPAPGRETDSETEQVFEITVAECLGVGHQSVKPPEAVVVRDTEGQIWFITETRSDDGNLRGLVSRWNVGPGMKLRLKVKGNETKAFPLTPEIEPFVL